MRYQNSQHSNSMAGAGLLMALMVDLGSCSVLQWKNFTMEK